MNEDIKINTPSDAQIIIDYDKMSDAFYDALVKKSDVDKKNALRYDFSDSDLLEFATSTDANLYTVSTVVAPTTGAQQQLAYILDIRNILLILLLFYFSFSIYSKIKTTVINYVKGRG